MNLIPRVVLLLSYSLNDSIRRSDYATRSTLPSDHNDATSPRNFSIAIVICAIIWSPLLLTLSPPSAPWLSNSTKSPQNLPLFSQQSKTGGNGRLSRKTPRNQGHESQPWTEGSHQRFNTLSISIHDLRYMACL
jgi:hypothetical protein